MRRQVRIRCCLADRRSISSVALLVACLSAIGRSCDADVELRSGAPLVVGTESGVGVFAGPSISCSPLGAVHVYGGRRPDLFVAGDRWHPGILLYRWKGDDSSGVPIFSQPIAIKPPFDNAAELPGYVLANEAGRILGFWLQGDQLRIAEFNKNSNRFESLSRTKITGLPRDATALAVRIAPDSQLEVFIAVSDGVVHKPGDHRAKDYTPYDGAGLWRGGLPRDGIYRFVCTWPKLPKQVTAEVVLPAAEGGLLGISGLDWIRPRSAPEGQLIFGTKLGGVFYVPTAFSAPATARSSAKVPVVDQKGVALRHPAVGTNLVAFTSAAGERTDLVAAGEGGMYYYRSIDRPGPFGQPAFEAPREVLQESAELFAGTLVVVNTVDWNGDGKLDIVAGNAAGQLVLFANQGTNERPQFLPATRIEAGDEPVLIRGGYRGSIQGPGEAHWGYTSPTVVDWNQDGQLDIVMNDIRGMHTVYLNRGTKTEPQLALPRELNVDALEMHGTWRTRPAAGFLGKRMAYITLDDDDQVHLFWRIDDFNLEDGGKLRLTDGSSIQANFLPVGGTGRAKFQLVDWDRDGKVDLLAGTPRHGSFPEPKHGVPWSMNAGGAAVLLLRNVGSNEQPVYEYPAVLHVGGKPMHFGQHECAPVATTLGSAGNELNLLVGTELGRMIFIRGRDVEWKSIR